MKIRMKSVAKATLPMFAALFATSFPAQAVTYTIKDLGTGWRPDGINDSGAIVGTAFGQNGAANVVKWSGGCSFNCLINLGSFGNGWATASGINNHDQIVGTYLTSDNAQRAFTYSSTGFVDLGVLGGRYSTATGINNLGQIVGLSTLDSGGYTAFIYKNGPMQDLGVSQVFYQSQATGINDAGLVIGMANPVGGLWSLGMTIDTANGNALTTINPLAGNPGISLTAINNAGVAVGYGYGNNPQAFTYAGGHMTPLEGQIVSQAFDINDHGQSVGYVQNAQGTGFYLNDGQALTFQQQLIGGNSSWSFLSGSKINNAGEIVGVGMFNGEEHAFLITTNQTPVLPPTTLPPVANFRIEGLSSFDPTKKTVVITHGWQPFGVNPEGWVEDMTDALSEAAPSENANILRVYWNDAITSGASAVELSAVNAKVSEVGTLLAARLNDVIGQSSPGIQFIGHSLGTHVNAYAVDALTKAGFTIDQFTILDRPFGNANYLESILAPPGGDFDQLKIRLLLPKDKVVWVDNYFGDNNTGLPPATGSSFGGSALAFNQLYAGAGHSEVHERYADTIMAAANCTDSGGFGCSILSGNFDQRPESAMWDPLLSHNIPVERVVSVNNSEWKSNNCVITGNSSATCSEGSPAYLWTSSFSVEDNDKYLEFQFDWLNKGDGDWLSVYFDDIPLFAFAGGSEFGDGVSSSGLLSISNLAGRNGQLLFSLNSVGQRNAQISIGNIRIFGSAMATVPEPQTFTMLIAGFGLVGFAMRKYRKINLGFIGN